jgi:hypothetical protein
VTAAPHDRANCRFEIDGLRAAGAMTIRLPIIVALPA